MLEFYYITLSHLKFTNIWWSRGWISSKKDVFKNYFGAGVDNVHAQNFEVINMKIKKEFFVNINVLKKFLEWIYSVFEQLRKVKVEVIVLIKVCIFFCNRVKTF